MIHIRKIVLFTILMLLFVGIANAAESTSNDDDSIDKVSTLMDDSQTATHADSTNELNSNIQKVENNKNTIKTSSEKIKTNTTIDPVLLDENNAANITARVTAVGSDEVVNTGKVAFKLNGKTLKDAKGKVIYIKVAYSMATIEYSFANLSSFDNLNLTATYSGSYLFNSSKSEAVQVQKVEDVGVVISIDDVTAKLGDKITLYATIKDLSRNNIQWGKVVFKINGKTVKDSNGNTIYANIVDGNASVEYDTSSLKTINNTITVVMLANTLYPKNDTKATLTITQDVTGDFTTLNNDINKTTGNLYQLDKDYDFNLVNDNDYTNGISIDKNNYTINGKNHIINAKGLSRIFNITGTNVTLKNIKFINANAENGGAIYSEYGVNLINCRFINNTANKSGGAVFIKNHSSNVEITSIFINNTSNNGGAIYITSNITNNTIRGEFINNTATRGGGAIFIRGMATDNNIDALFENNIAKEASGGAIFFYTTCLNSIFDGTFKYNQAMYGAGIFFYYQANNNIFNITFMNNTAGSCGGAMFFYNTTTNNTFNGVFEYNRGLIGNGGAMTFKDVCTNSTYNCNFMNNSAGNHGGALNFRQKPHNLTINSNFTSNQGKYGGAINFYDDKDNVDITGLFIDNHATDVGDDISYVNYD